MLDNTSIECNPSMPGELQLVVGVGPPRQQPLILEPKVRMAIADRQHHGSVMCL